MAKIIDFKAKQNELKLKAIQAERPQTLIITHGKVTTAGELLTKSEPSPESLKKALNRISELFKELNELTVPKNNLPTGLKYSSKLPIRDK